MKFRMAFLVWGAMTTGAHASSFVVLDPMTKPVGPSMIVLGSPAPAPVAAAPKATSVAAAKPGDFRVPLAFPLPGEETAEIGREVANAAPLPAAQPNKPADRSATRSQATDPSAYHVPLPRVLSPSIIAFGEVQPPVSYEQLASIGPEAAKKTSRRPAQMPMVIRGGLIGDAFARPAVAAPAEPVQVEAKAPGAAGGSPQPKDAPAKRDTPPAAPPPPEPPTRKPE